MNWLDAVLTVILVIGVYRGAKTGLILSCIRLVGVVVAFVLTSRYYSVIGDIVERQWHFADILSAWLSHVYKIPPDSGGIISAQQSALTLAAAGKPGLPGSDPVFILARKVINAGIFLVLFGIIERLWFFVGEQITFFRKWLPFRPFDRLGGVALGAGWGFVLGMVLVLVLHYAARLSAIMMGQENFIVQALGTSVLTPFYEGMLRMVGGLFAYNGIGDIMQT
ncbi:MAG: CvpA family protein [Bacillota bacterium]